LPCSTSQILLRVLTWFVTRLAGSSIVTTADTYTSVLLEAAHRRPGHRRHGHQGRPQRPSIQVGGTVVPRIPAAITPSGHCQM
jgi:hypothetical protein